MQLSSSITTFGIVSRPIVLNMTGTVVVVLYNDTNYYGQAVYYDTTTYTPSVCVLCPHYLRMSRRALFLILCFAVPHGCERHRHSVGHDRHCGDQLHFRRVLPPHLGEQWEVLCRHDQHRSSKCVIWDPTGCVRNIELH